MKILLVGEYSRLHNSLKEGLTSLGHDVLLVGTGDGFKDFPADIKLIKKFQKGLSAKWRTFCVRFLNFDPMSKDLEKQFFKHSQQFKGFDVVQLINEVPLGSFPSTAAKLISFLSDNNKKLFLLSCGTDYISVSFDYQQNRAYSIFTPFFEGKIRKEQLLGAFKYMQTDHQNLHHHIYSLIDGVIASDLDYHEPLMNHSQYKGLIPNPINTDVLEAQPFPKTDRIVIFHGINRGNYFKKGNDLFESALKAIQERFPTTVDIITVEDVPYQEYIQKYNKAHILLDQVYAYDQGYNALEAMAKGKVVFTGAEEIFLKQYDLKEDEVCINAEPEAKKIEHKLAWLIENPSELERISNNARKFIEKEHHYIKVAQRYVDIWNG